MDWPDSDQMKEALEELETSFRERGYAFHLHCDDPGRIWRNLYAEAEEVFVALTPGLTLAINGALKQAPPLEEVFLEPGHRFDIVGNSAHACRWVYGYEIAGTKSFTRVLRSNGLLMEEDWLFAQTT